MNRPDESAIPSATEALRIIREEQKAKEKGAETTADRLSARKIAEQQQGGAQ